MLQVGISWAWIGLSVVSVGYMVTHLLNKAVGYKKEDIDTVLMLGICFLAVYAQTFSLIYKVGAIASGLLLCVILVSVVFLWKSLWQFIRQLLEALWKEKWVFFLMFGLACILVVLTSLDIAHYDTYLYHAQSIRWIEEYGIVPGLGNLHNRIAYNSSVFCLQGECNIKCVSYR